uniref:PAP-associated domain-containing protein n=1 Tax=Rhabditophanes sp. KR3021 TaxID=114890 RepID=A0AC35UGF3_9BILA
MGNFEICNDNIFDLIEVQKVINCPELSTQLKAYVTAMVDPVILPRLFDKTRHEAVKDIQELTLPLISTFFKKLEELDAFDAVSYDCMITIFTLEFTKTKDQEVVYNVFNRWAELHTNRKSGWLNLIKRIDFTKVSKKFMADITSSPMMLEVFEILGLSKTDNLSDKIFHCHATFSQSEHNLNRKLYLRDMIYYTISPMFPLCGLYIVGSSLNGFGHNASDMDLCLMLTNKELDQRRDAVPILNAIKNKIAKVEWVSDLQLIVAKVPILRITFNSPFHDIVVDLNANNAVAIKNTHLLFAYSNFDWRVRPLVSVVKEWAKKRGMNDANKSTFTSYSLVLMCIHYLQCGVSQRILPSLQDMYPEHFNNNCDARNLSVDVTLDIPVEDRWKFNTDATLSELLLGFLKYYATEFDYETDAISIRLGIKTTRSEMLKGNASDTINAQWRCICIEEPFTHMNTAHSIYDVVVFKAIKNCFSSSWKCLRKYRDFNKFLNGPNIQEELGTHALIPPGGVLFNHPKDGTIYKSDSNDNPKSPIPQKKDVVEVENMKPSPVVSVSKKSQQPRSKNRKKFKKGNNKNSRTNLIEIQKVEKEVVKTK